MYACICYSKKSLSGKKKNNREEFQYWRWGSWKHVPAPSKTFMHTFQKFCGIRSGYDLRTLTLWGHIWILDCLPTWWSKFMFIMCIYRKWGFIYKIGSVFLHLICWNLKAFPVGFHHLYYGSLEWIRFSTRVRLSEFPGDNKPIVQCLEASSHTCSFFFFSLGIPCLNVSPIYDRK